MVRVCSNKRPCETSATGVGPHVFPSPSQHGDQGIKGSSHKQLNNFYENGSLTQYILIPVNSGHRFRFRFRPSVRSYLHHQKYPSYPILSYYIYPLEFGVNFANPSQPWPAQAPRPLPDHVPPGVPRCGPCGPIGPARPRYQHATPCTLTQIKGRHNTDSYDSHRRVGT